MTSIDDAPQPVSAKKHQLSIDLRLVVAVLVLIIGAMLILWKPWMGSAADARTIEVRGETTLRAQPDEFVFYPGYKFENTDKNIALAELTKKSNELTGKLKELGVPESKIKTATNGGASGMYGPAMPKEERADTNYMLQLTVTVNDSKMAQKVQDYLVGTAPTGSVSPQATFSEAKRKELEDKGRAEALKDSKTKADRTASELGFKVDKVKTVHDGSLSVYSNGSAARGMDATESTKSSLSIHAGENELPYSVTVTYFIY